MKKSFFTLLLMLATMSMTAQTIDGTWAADEAFRKEMGLDKEEPAMNLIISFDKVKIKLIEAEVKNSSAGEISQIGELATLFKVFKVKFDGNDRMNLIIGDEVIGFNRVK